jgi:hypothetical protein
MKTTHFGKDTPAKIRQWLETAREQERRVRVFYGDTEREDFEQVHGHKADPGKDWGEENDVIGYIGRSMGEKAIPLLIANSRSSGGGGILDDCIVRMFVKGRAGWQEVYQHPNYHSEYDNAEVVESALSPEYSHAVKTAGGEVARFHSERSAKNYLAFMRGERFSK